MTTSGMPKSLPIYYIITKSMTETLQNVLATCIATHLHSLLSLLSLKSRGSLFPGKSWSSRSTIISNITRWTFGSRIASITSLSLRTFIADRSNVTLGPFWSDVTTRSLWTRWAIGSIWSLSSLLPGDSIKSWESRFSFWSRRSLYMYNWSWQCTYKIYHDLQGQYWHNYIAT